MTTTGDHPEIRVVREGGLDLGAAGLALSFPALGLLVWLLHAPEEAVALTDAGVDNIRELLLEFGRAGYLTHHYERDGTGRWQTLTRLYDNTDHATPHQFTTPEGRTP